jgi:hypothetical protein
MGDISHMSFFVGNFSFLDLHEYNLFVNEILGIQSRCIYLGTLFFADCLETEQCEFQIFQKTASLVLKSTDEFRD